MTLEEWSIAAGLVGSAAAALGPWMTKVHAKLAVIATRIIDLCDKIDEARDEHRRLWDVCSRHESRLDTHDVQISHIAERLRKET
jgi:hypothetical protein